MVRGGKEGRVYGPLLVITYLVDIVNSGIWKGMKILVVIASKGLCRRTKVLKVLALKGLCYGMVIDVSHWENPPPP